MEDLSITWKPDLIIISYMVAVQASYTTVLILQMRFSRWMNILAALSISVTGIWSMHFIGMAAMEVAVDVTYDIGWTVASAIFAFIMTLAAFLIMEVKVSERVSTDDISIAAHINAFLTAPHPWILLSAVHIALGVCIMHYTGMHAMSSVASRKMDWGVIVASVLIALFAATAALYFAFVFPLTRRYTIPTALVMGVAVCGMHYTGMYGMTYAVDPALKLPHSGTSSIRDVVLYIVFAAGAINASILGFSSFLYRLSLRSAADRAHDIALAILAARFDDIDTTSDEKDPEIRRITDAYIMMGKQLKTLRCYLPQSLLAQIDAEYAENGEGDGQEEVPPGEIDADLQTISSDKSDSLAASGSHRRSQVGRKSILNHSIVSGDSTKSSEDARKGKYQAQADALALGVVRRNVTVMAVNIRNFHQKLRDVEASQVVAWYGEKLDIAIKSIGNQGVLSHFHGDHIFVSFNASRPSALHMRQAGKAAVAMRGAFELLGLPVTIGIASGTALVGNLGGTQARCYNILGNVFTQAAVLERMCKSYEGVSILCSHQGFADQALELDVRNVGVARLPGDAHIHTVHTILGLAERETNEWMYELENDENGPNVRINSCYTAIAEGNTTAAAQILKKMIDEPGKGGSVGPDECARLDRLVADTEGAVNASMAAFYKQCVL